MEWHSMGLKTPHTTSYNQEGSAQIRLTYKIWRSQTVQNHCLRCGSRCGCIHGLVSKPPASDSDRARISSTPQWAVGIAQMRRETDGTWTPSAIVKNARATTLIGTLRRRRRARTRGGIDIAAGARAESVGDPGRGIGKKRGTRAQGMCLVPASLQRTPHAPLIEV